ncbi:MAG: CHAD domain-containing protein [Acidobacteria bacterium]|nr:CHAD domain-containing protein [Acidobacteriota bacterium]
MAKAKEIAGLDCAADALNWAAEVLRVRFDEVVGLRGAALDFSDIEGVHAMRVATKRLRSALRDFLPLMSKRPLKRVRKELKQIADRLGAVRDHDVAIVALERLKDEAEIELIKAGIEKLLEERSVLREAARSRLTAALEGGGDFDDLRGRFAAAIDEAARRKKSKRTISFNEAGRKAVADSLRDLIDLGASLYEPFKTAELHEARIAAKRLRYAVELLVHCWGERIAPFADEIAEMQSFLGEVHDCDVWIEILGEQLRRRRKNETREVDYQTDIWLLSEFVKKRTKEYRSALKLWSGWENENFAERMRAMIQSS